MTNVAQRFQPDISGSAVPTGYIGESVETSVGSTAAAASNTPFNIGSVSVPAGRWRIDAYGFFSVGTVAGNTGAVFDINTTSASLRSPVRYTLGTTNSGTQNFSSPVHSMELNVASGSTTTVYLVGQYNYSTIGSSTMSGSIKYTRIA
jgi:hypothetical protein